MKSEFDSVLEQFGPLLGRVAASYEANPDLRQELLQEICLAVWQALSRFAGNSSLKTYVLRVAHNKAVNHVSYQARQPYNETYCEVTAPQAAGHAATPESGTEKQRQSEALVDAVRELPLQSRQIVTMSMEGLSYQEIADVCGLKVTNVGVILNRARKQLMEKVHNV